MAALAMALSLARPAKLFAVGFQMQLKIDDGLAAEVLSALDDFSGPINHLNDLLWRIQEDGIRWMCLRQLAGVMGCLEEIGHPLRLSLQRTD
jgi:hypothetical protein